MELICNAAVWLITMLTGFLGGVLANDACESADRICTWIINRAVLRLAEFDRENTKCEWLADLNERETASEKYHHAIGCLLCADLMRKQALKVILAVDVAVAGFGTVPLRFGTGVSLKFVGVVTSRMSKSSTPNVWAFCLTIYLFLKLFLSAYRTDRANIKGFLRQISHFEKWKYDVRIERKDLSLNITKLLMLIRANPAAGKEYCDKICDALRGRGTDKITTTSPESQKPIEP